MYRDVSEPTQIVHTYTEQCQKERKKYQKKKRNNDLELSVATAGNRLHRSIHNDVFYEAKQRRYEI